MTISETRTKTVEVSGPRKSLSIMDHFHGKAADDGQSDKETPQNAQDLQLALVPKALAATQGAFTKAAHAVKRKNASLNLATAQDPTDLALATAQEAVSQLEEANENALKNAKLDRALERIASETVQDLRSNMEKAGRGEELGEEFGEGYLQQAQALH